MHPNVRNKNDIMEHVLGPYESKTVPRNNGDIDEKNIPATNIATIYSSDSPGPPSVSDKKNSGYTFEFKSALILFIQTTQHV